VRGGDSLQNKMPWMWCRNWGSRWRNLGWDS